MDTTAQQGSRVHEAEHALPPVGRVRCSAAREAGSGDPPFIQPLGGSFPHQHPVCPCSGAAWRWVHITAELSWAPSSL